MPKTIINILDYIDALPAEDRKIFDRLFDIEKVVGTFADDPVTEEALLKFFGSAKEYKDQTIIKAFNKITYEGTLYSSVRAMRPVKIILKPEDFQKAMNTAKRDFDFVPEDIFGSVRGKHSFTSANIAKYDAVHSLVIYDDDNPLDFDREKIRDYFDTAVQWFHKAHAAYPDAQYPLFIWNCLWKSGGSIVHGHAQVLLASRRHYPRIEYLRHVSHEYEKEHIANFFSDLFRVHQSLGLGFEVGKFKVMNYLTAIKEKELMILTPEVNEDFTNFLYDVLDCYIHDIGVTSFNLCMAFPPCKHTEKEWGHFPVIVRIVDRGNPLSKISDIGAMELYAASVVASDPYKVASILSKKLMQD